MEEIVNHRSETREFLKKYNCSTYKEVKELFKKSTTPEYCCLDCIRCIGKAKSINQYCKLGMVQYRDASGDEINLPPAKGIMKFMQEVVEGIKDIKENGYGNEDVWEEMKKKDFEKRTEKFNKRKQKALEKEEFKEYQKKKFRIRNTSEREQVHTMMMKVTLKSLISVLLSMMVAILVLKVS